MSTITKLEGNDDLIEGILETLANSGISEEDLDEDIHDIADLMASNLNNEGIESQVRAILDSQGIEGGIKLLNQRIEEAGGETAIQMPTNTE